MEPAKSVFLRTYGKQMRRISAWISPKDHKKAFDSSLSTEDDISVFEPPARPARKREKRTSVACRKLARPAKKKALLCLREKSFDEENVISPPPHPEAAQQSKATRRKKKTCNRASVLNAKRKAVLQVIENISDEENISPSPPRLQLAQQSKTTGKSQPESSRGVLSKRTKRGSTVNAKINNKETSFEKKKPSDVHFDGRFVTCRNHQTETVAKSTIPKAIESIFNSSDDFTSRQYDHVRTTQTSTTTRQRIPSSFLVSTVEKSKTSTGIASFANDPPQEISLNESGQNRLRKFTDNPIFCSTPSAGSLCSRPAFKSFSIIDKSVTPPSSVLSPFQVQQDSHKQPVSPPILSTSIGLKSSPGEQAPPLPHYKELSCDLFIDYKSTNQKSSSSGEDKNYREDIKINNDETLPSVIIVSIDSESSSDHVSAAKKEKCLTNHCTVQLQRLETLNVTLGQTIYSTCLGLSGHSPLSSSAKHIQTASFYSTVFMPNTNTGGNSELLNDIESVGQAALPKDHSASEESMQSAACHRDTSVNSVTSAQIPASSLNTVSTEVLTVQLEDKWLLKKCSVPLKRLDFSELAFGHLNGKEAHLSHNDRSVEPDVDESHYDTLDPNNTQSLSCSNEESKVMSLSPSVVLITNSQKTEEASAGLTAILKESCISRQFKVDLKRLSLSQLKGDTKKKADKLVSKSAGDEQSSHQSDSDHDRHKDVSINIKRKILRSTSSEDTTSSDSKMTKIPCDVLPKRRKTSSGPKEKKRKGMSKDRSGTTRKACVSGLSVSRWKNNSSISKRPWGGNTSTMDCSMNELISIKYKPKDSGIMNFSTPARTNQHNISSLLANLTPNTNTWSRLKAALSVHRKVLLSPMNLHLSDTQRTTVADVSLDLFATPLKSLLPKAPQSQQKQKSMLCGDTDLSDAEKVYSECSQEQPLAWEDCILPHRMNHCVKIGEGTFGEVFSTINEFGDKVALKVIPIEGTEKVNGEDQKTFGEILHEIIISKELSCLKDKKNNQTHGFIGLHDLHCVQGCYPCHFLNAWDKFDQKRGSENDRPDFFENDQLFLILEFEFGGVDLENSNGTLASLGVAKSILHQVTAALAVAEQELHFEHRDLHWGNILVKATKQKTGSFMLNGEAHSVETQGVLVRIIDNSLSRLEIDNLTVSCDISHDEELFMGQGDYQFEIYRLMRQENGNNWSDYHPHTNVLWLHYLCSKLLSMKYKRGVRGVKEVRVELTNLYDNILDYSSATEVLRNCPLFQ